MKLWTWEDPDKEFFHILVERHGHGGAARLPQDKQIQDVLKIDAIITRHGTVAEKAEWMSYFA